jgi:hypothetical protein
MMYKRMNDEVWKIEDQGDGTVNLKVITPDSEEYEAAIAAIEAEQQSSPS